MPGTSQSLSMAAVPPPQYGHYIPFDPSRPMTLLLATSLVLSLSVTASTLRLASSIARKRRLTPPDYPLLPALLFSLLLCLEAFLAVPFGVGEHMNSFSAARMRRLLDLFSAWDVTYPLAKTAAQLAILFSMAEPFFESRSRKASPCLAICLAATEIFTLAVGFTWSVAGSFLQTDLRAALTPFEPDPRLISDARISVIVLNATFAATSVATLALSIFQIWFAKASWRRKGAMCALWFVGFFITWCVGAFITTMLYVIDSRDFSYTWIDPLIISVVEVGSAVVVACIPAIAALFTRPGAPEAPVSGVSVGDEKEKEIEDESDCESSKPLLK